MATLFTFSITVPARYVRSPLLVLSWLAWLADGPVSTEVNTDIPSNSTEQCDGINNMSLVSVSRSLCKVLLSHLHRLLHFLPLRLFHVLPRSHLLIGKNVQRRQVLSWDWRQLLSRGAPSERQWSRCSGNASMCIYSIMHVSCIYIWTQYIPYSNTCTLWLLLYTSTHTSW